MLCASLQAAVDLHESDACMPKSRPSSNAANKALNFISGGTAQSPPERPDNFLVVGIGASAGGLEASTKLLAALPPATGMAFILVQHLDPLHESMMPELLSHHTTMVVVQATDGMLVEPEHLYIIPPGTYLSVQYGRIHISRPEMRHRARMPFDFLLPSLANEYGERAVCVILSGTGADGSLGLKAIKELGGLVIAQDAREAAYDGMPRNAILSGAVDLILPLASIPTALVKYHRRMSLARIATTTEVVSTDSDWLPEIITLLRDRKAHDFRLYKEGTLRRRIERRMAMASIESDDIARYIDSLRNDPSELDRLASDLLINVTSFFRDPKVFEVLSHQVIPELVRAHSIDQPLRVWIAGCSTGEETYSLAMLFREAITAAKREIKLQIFASDVDADAVATAREGLYPETISSEVSSERLTRFFSKDEHGYKILPELRATIVFAVQDVLADPPFSRLDLISCRNLLIYLRPEAQEKVISFFHFALREGGILLLGSAETVGSAKSRFEVISKPERIFRHIASSRPGDVGFLFADGVMRQPPRALTSQLPSRQMVLAEACRRLVLEAYAPAAVLINRKFEYLYSLGPTERYLHVPQGQPSLGLFAMVRPRLRTKLRAAIHQAIEAKTRISLPGGRTNQEGRNGTFTIAVQPAPINGEDLLLICFIDDPAPAQKLTHESVPHESEQLADLRQQLNLTQAELQAAIQSLETSDEEQKAINEEALSVNEEYQSTNEELLTSKEELQSMNEELTALNSQIQETLERQRTTANDLQNILYSTNVATIFLDIDLHIRFFTPATKALFKIIPTDIGRPLSDLNSLAGDNDLLTDASSVLRGLSPLEREIRSQDGLWYIRRIMPYRAQDNRVEGVVVTFVDITERRRVADALEAAKFEAQQANIAKSRFLAAASHDLRQPLQSLSLMHGALLRKIRDGKKEDSLALVTRLDETSAAMAGMLNTLLDINQLEAGTVTPNLTSFPINVLLNQLREEFNYHASARNLTLRVVKCSLSVYSDQRLLEQMLRNLLSNALKYTRRGKILLGCRRHHGVVSLEVWDTGIGIADQDLDSIFDEYHQLDNSGPDIGLGLGLGLGLSIVQRFAALLGHHIHVRSIPGKGSAFSIDVRLTAPATILDVPRTPAGSHAIERLPSDPATVLLIEDEHEVRELLDMILTEEGYQTATAEDGASALALLARADFSLDVILTDYNLPNGMDGLAVAAKIREGLRRKVPVIVLTGDISTDALRRIASHDCIPLNKPVKARDLTDALQLVLTQEQGPTRRHLLGAIKRISTAPRSTLFVIDDDGNFREGIRSLFEEAGHTVEDFASCEAFLDAYPSRPQGCLLVDAYLPDMQGLELLQLLKPDDGRLPVIMVTGHSDVRMAVQAMKCGARDFIEKPFDQGELLASVNRALEQSQDATKLSVWRSDAAQVVSRLTQRQRQIMELVLAGHPSKNIAADLNLSQRTVENHRAQIMRKTGAKSLPALARLALAAGVG